MKPLLFLIASTLTACLPGNDGGAAAKQNPASGQRATITAVNGRYSIKLDPPSVALTDLRSLTLATKRQGKIDVLSLKGGRYATALSAGDSPLSFVFTAGAGAGTVCKSDAAGASVPGKVAVSCGAE